jgi:hypothetical protein
MSSAGTPKVLGPSVMEGVPDRAQRLTWGKLPP